MMDDAHLPTGLLAPLPNARRWRSLPASSWLVVCVFLLVVPALEAQTRRTTPRRTTPAAAAPKTEPAMINCPQPLGTGVQTKRAFCDVLIGRDPAAGIIITLPPHTGPVTLTFDLHNRHTYSEELVRSGRGYRRYFASIGVLALDNTLLSRAYVQTEFRTAADLVDRIAGGSPPAGVKAVAPTGTESISIEIPAEETSVTILGETLQEQRPDGSDEFMASGRPIAIISNVMVTYRPAPAPRATPTRRR
jgi:hypothetical protein